MTKRETTIDLHALKQKYVIREISNLKKQCKTKLNDLFMDFLGVSKYMCHFFIFKFVQITCKYSDRFGTETKTYVSKNNFIYTLKLHIHIV